MIDCNSAIKVTSFCENNLPYIKITGDEISRTDIAKTFDCGQSFRFNKYENSRHNVEYSGVAYGKFISFAQDENALYIYNTTEDEYNCVWRGYLALDLNYKTIAKDIIESMPHPIMKEAVECGQGIRILRQEPWEIICSFIVSQNNNIPRIKKIIESLSRHLGKGIDSECMNCHGAENISYTFPTPEAIVNGGISLLCDLKTGFRAKYIYDAAEKVSTGVLDIETLRCENTEACIEKLCCIHGVGIKVASCSALFAYEKYDSFPVDVWIKRVLEKYFDKDIEISSFGKYAGIAQQYLFYYERYVNSNR